VAHAEPVRAGRGAALCLVALLLGLVCVPVSGAEGGPGAARPLPELLLTEPMWQGVGPWVAVQAFDGGRPGAWPILGTDPAWSPAGSWVAFRTTGDAYKALLAGIYVAKPDGSSLTRLTSDVGAGAANTPLAWSPDGTSIAYLSRPASGGVEVWIVPVAGGPAHLLTRSRGGLSGLEWSPTGALLLSTTSGSVTTIGSTTGAETSLARGSEPAWSPDGSRIAYVDKAGRVAVMNADGSSSRELTGLFSDSPAWSPDGAEVVFTGDVEQLSGPYGGGTRVDLYVAPADASAPPRRLTGPFDPRAQPSGDSLQQPAFSPDGALILYRDDLYGNEVVNADGSCAHPLPLVGDAIGRQAWQPHSLTDGPISCVDLRAYPYSSRGWGVRGSVPPVALGAQATVTLIVENDGNRPAHDVVVHLAPTTPAGEVHGCGSVPIAGDSCTLGTLAPGSSQSVDLGLSAAVAGQVGLTYSVTSTESDLVPGDTTGTITTTVLPCTLVGTPGHDQLQGTPQPDRICGLAGADKINGGPGNDYLDGGSGNDTITGGPGRDTILGGSGNDLIRARDGERDRIDCGPGHDVAIVDANDSARNCEEVER
jgi:Tol biopolymer transport system component